MTTEKFTFSGEENISDILAICPQAMPILFDAGLGCAMCPMAGIESLRDGCLAHGMDDAEIQKIVDAINAAHTTES